MMSLQGRRAKKSQRIAPLSPMRSTQSPLTVKRPPKDRGPGPTEYIVPGSIGKQVESTRASTPSAGTLWCNTRRVGLG